MLQNYVVDADLKIFYPNLAKQMWATQVNYQPQIDKAFDIMLNDLHSAQVKPERILQLDLKNTGTDKNAGPVITNEIVSTTGQAFPSHYERRVTIHSLVSNTGSGNFRNSISIQGNNDPQTSSADWQEIVNIIVPESYSSQTITQTFTSTFSFLRYVTSIQAPENNLYCSIIASTDIFHNLVVHKALAMIFKTFIKEDGDAFDIIRKDEEQTYQMYLRRAKFAYDESKTGDPAKAIDNYRVLDIVMER